MWESRMPDNRAYELFEGLPPLLRSRLETAAAQPPTIVDVRTSADGARKYVFALHDGNRVEAVGIPRDGASCADRLAVCFSSQVGCAMKCAFCATGKQDLTRNLDAAEMLWQIVLVGADFGCRVDTVLAMGQGEPLANHAALLEAFGILGDPAGLSLGAHSLMVSTCGVLGGIRALAASPVPATLNISLHAATQDLRDRLMPGISSASLDSLHAELVRYCKLTGRRIIIQYLLLDGVNDSEDDLRALQDYCRGLDAMVKLLHFNCVEGIPFAPSSSWTMAFWSLALNRDGIPTTANNPRGADISAACGQLVNEVMQHG